jgi:hypothetical protein
MKLNLQAHHLAHLKRIGLADPPQSLEFSIEELQAAEKVWAHRYGGEILEMKALAHIAWKQQKTKENAEPELHPDVQHVATHLKRTYRSLWLLAALLAFLTFFVATAHCQFSKIKTVSATDGTHTVFAASPFSMSFTGCTVGGTGSAWTISCASGGTNNPGGSLHQLQTNGGTVFNGVGNGTAGQVLCSNGATLDPSMCDPVVSGPDAPGVAPTKNPVQVGLFDGTNVQRILGSAAGRLSVDVNSAPTTAVTGTFFQSTQPVSSLQLPAALDGSGFLKTHEQGTAAISAASLPLPSGAATAAKQPALGTAGTPAADVISIQGVTSMTPVKVDGSGVTQPVSGTVTVQQATGTNLHTVCDSGCSSSTAPADGATFNEGTTSFSPFGGYFRTSPTSLTTDHMGAVGMTATRHLFVNLPDALPAGTNVIGHVIADSDSTTAVTALPATPTGSNVIGKVGIDQTTPGTTNAVQAANFPATVDTNSGVKSASTIRVILATDQPQLTNKILVTPDSVALPANQSVNVNQVAGAASSATNPLYIRETDGTNAVVLDPCRTQANIFKPISQTASAQLVTGTAAKKIYICSINLVTAAANNVAMVEGTGTVCATGIAGMAGGTTAATGWNFAANGGLTQGNGMGSIMAEATNADNLCLLQSAAVQLSGSIGYVVQ